MSAPRLRQIARHAGAPVLEATLESAEARVAVISFGAAVTDWRVRLPGGGERAVALALPCFAAHRDHAPAFGAIVGRVANRVAGARLRLGGRTHRLIANDGPHTLHGGPIGLARRNWRMAADGDALRLACDSPDGEEGWPGAVAFEVRLTLDGPTLTWEMHGRPDRPTPIALAQHVYWNLDGATDPGPVSDHRLRLAASRHTPAGPDLIPTGEIAPVEGTPLDFRTPRRLRDAAGRPLALDVNVALDPGEGPAAEAWSAAGDLRLALWTDRPGLQVYDAPDLALPVPGWEARPFAGLCLEAQDFPNAVHEPGFPSVIATPERPYRQLTSVAIAPP
ncbi:MAG: aldose epimerase family protein [Paracoccaceae bacterium]